MKKFIGNFSLACILGHILVIALLFGVANTVYGNIFKMQTLKNTIKCDLFDDGKLIKYSYFPGKLSATLTFPKHQYEEVKKELQSQNVACLFRTIDYELVLPLKIPNTIDKQVEIAEYFVGGPLDNFCGILCCTEDEVIFYITQPSYSISEKWKKDKGTKTRGRFFCLDKNGEK